MKVNRAERITLIHAVYAAMAPVERAFAKLWPEAHHANLVDDALSQDLESAGFLTPDLFGRIQLLTDYAIATGATAVLFTCSAFGEAIARCASQTTIPVLKPNEAMFEASIRAGRRIGMLATFQPAVASMTKEFEALVHDHQADVSLETICVPEAMAAARSGDIDLHNRLVADAALRLAHCDAVMLAHFSTSTAWHQVQARLKIPVFSAPEAAVSKLKTLLSR